MCNHYQSPAQWTDLPDELALAEVPAPSNQTQQWPARQAPVVRAVDNHLVVEHMIWGFPTTRPSKRDPQKQVTQYWTNARNLDAALWRRWATGAAHRCLVPLTAFAEPDATRGKGGMAWFAMAQGLPEIFCFAGLWQPTPKGAHFAFLTCAPNPLVGAVHPKAMPVILASDDYAHWLAGAPAAPFQKAFPASQMRNF